MGATATSARTFEIGGEIEVTRLGYGAMRITGEGIWGPPEDPDGAIAVLKRLPELGVDFIDTADSYGPEDSESLIREALHPFNSVHASTRMFSTTASRRASASSRGSRWPPGGWPRPAGWSLRSRPRTTQRRGRWCSPDARP
jgi:aryl-alcohol dehydrogenase-like predicted oxidoreductase